MVNVAAMAMDHQECEILNLAVVRMAKKNHGNCILKEIFVMLRSSSSVFYELQKSTHRFSEQAGGIF